MKLSSSLNSFSEFAQQFIGEGPAEIVRRLPHHIFQDWGSLYIFGHTGEEFWYQGVRPRSPSDGLFI